MAVLGGEHTFMSEVPLYALCYPLFHQEGLFNLRRGAVAMRDELRVMGLGFLVSGFGCGFRMRNFGCGLRVWGFGTPAAILCSPPGWRRARNFKFQVSSRSWDEEGCGP
jgi:hypothetical protein